MAKCETAAVMLDLATTLLQGKFKI